MGDSEGGFIPNQAESGKTSRAGHAGRARSTGGRGNEFLVKSVETGAFRLRETFLHTPEVQEYRS